MIDFSTLKSLKIPEGNVKEIAIDGVTVWKSNKTLGELAVGTSVFMKNYSTTEEFIVVHQGNPDPTLYDSSCDGTWLLRKDIHSKRVFDSGYDSWYSNSDIDKWLKNTYINGFDYNHIPIKTVKVPWRMSEDSTDIESGADGHSTTFFLLSYAEIGGTSSTAPREGTVLKYFNGAGNSERIAYYNGTATVWWLRTPDPTSDEDDEEQVYAIISTGQFDTVYVDSSFGVRPACILPSSTPIDENFNIVV